MSVIGFLMDDLTEKGRFHWDALPGAGYGEYTYDFPGIREIFPGATEQRLIESGGDLSLTPVVIETAKKLEKKGLRRFLRGADFNTDFYNEGR